ncbi:BspA family leucine-rich repeat surface protein [Leucobacter sp. UT-8R-CII-1-4]|uniref:BspA family leucine-rich repeat surface protein n=1 Tax=Leucobacter sp. UT-8R-CII-1-4 TaxID=3040075 RepID=UPI0024A99B8D|nr:BspA family leucine-rich repeat surface protein [Leucobacter sp. UT-8R-CII-1-4]MDI6024448.1 BspA family leucine-rich repeat surface protein [Leucobacter sp. UT-8R-CII-1-4]
MTVSGAVLSVTMLCGAGVGAAAATDSTEGPFGIPTPTDTNTIAKDGQEQTVPSGPTHSPNQASLATATPAEDSEPPAAPGGVTGVDGTAQWILYEDGTLEFGPGTLSPEGSFAYWRFLSQSVSKIVFLDPAATVFPANSSGLFRDLPNLRTVENAGEVDTSQVTNFARFMQGNEALESIDVSGWNTTKVQNFEGMFFGASALTSLDPSTWDTGNATRLDGMFADASSLSSLDLNAWDTSKVQGFVAVFQGASSLTELKVSNWDTSAGTDFAATFVNVSALESLDLTHWNTSNATRTIDMLAGTLALSQFTIGSNTNLADDSGLGEAPQTAPYTGKWVLIGDGTAVAPQGPWSGSASELVAHSRNGSAAGSYVFQQQLSVAFDGNGGDVTGAVGGVAGSTGELLALPANGFTRPGYTFVAWNTAADGSGVSYEASTEAYLANGVSTLFAQWKKNDDGGVTPPVKPPVTGGKLANTGSESGPMVGIVAGAALALLGAGAAATAASRRQKRA